MIPSKQIVHSTVFESAVVKIKAGRKQDFSTSVKCAARGPLLQQSALPEANPAPNCVVKPATKRPKASATTTKFKYQKAC